MTQRHSVTRWLGGLGLVLALVGLVSQGATSAQTSLGNAEMAPAVLAATQQDQEERPAQCVDINRADSDELQQIIHIGLDRAQQILMLRRERPSRSVNDLTRVNGIAAARLRDIIAQGVACVHEAP